jgi:hypothetical protein
MPQRGCRSEYRAVVKQRIIRGKNSIDFSHSDVLGIVGKSGITIFSPRSRAKEYAHLLPQMPTLHPHENISAISSRPVSGLLQIAACRANSSLYILPPLSLCCPLCDVSRCRQGITNPDFFMSNESLASGSAQTGTWGHEVADPLKQPLENRLDVGLWLNKQGIIIELYILFLLPPLRKQAGVPRSNCTSKDIP